MGDSSAVPGNGDATFPTDDGSLEAAPDSASSGEADGGATSDGAGSISVDGAPGVLPDAGPTASDAGDGGAADSAPAPVDATSDARLEDTSAPDALAGPDTGPSATPDGAGAPETGADGSVDATTGAPDGSSALTACTTAGQAGCVQCQYNNGAAGTLPNASALCTPTEAALVRHDIASGKAVSAGPAPDGSCYACAALSGCLDDSEFNDQGHECEDISGGSGAAACEATIACILQTSCGSSALSACYCGTAPESGSCAGIGASNAANGACKALEASGLGFAATDGLDVLKSFTSTTLPAGVANNIFECASSNGCSACLQ